MVAGGLHFRSTASVQSIVSMSETPQLHPPTRRVGLISKPAKPELARILPELLRWLGTHHYEVIVDDITATYVAWPKVVARTKMADHDLNFVIVMGGDGTLISAARAVAPKGVPILGVNLGTLGFLTEVPLTGLYEALDCIEEERARIELRSMVHSEVMRDGRLIASFDALNDVVVNKTSIARLASFDLYIDGVFVSSNKADGLIVATPTGSTAYSLAAGGPVLMPNVDAFVITPVSPHALTHRPLVVKDTAEIEIVVGAGKEDSFLSIDGQEGTEIKDGDRIYCRKSDVVVKLLRSQYDFFDALRTKLKWGERL